jgi:chromosome partitioning protein
MYVITFANPKGGSGKTTSAMLLAEQIANAGGKVTILDCDPNQNIVLWAKLRSKEGRAVPFNILPVPREDTFLDTVEAQKGKTDYLIIDLEGTASQMVTFATSQSDLVLIPLEPTPMETRQAARAVQLVQSTGRMVNRKISFALLFTRVNAAFPTNDEKDVRKSSENNDIPVLPTALVRRAPFTRIFREGALLAELRADAVADGQGATKSAQERALKPIDGAIQNAQEFAQEVMNCLERQEVAA